LGGTKVTTIFQIREKLAGLVILALAMAAVMALPM
jgi:hypothetical protein